MDNKIFIASEFKCIKFQGDYYLPPKAYNIYKRYADSFGPVILCSRFLEVEEKPSGYYTANFIIDVIEINSLISVLLGDYNTIIKRKIADCDLVIARVPSIIAYKASDCAHKLDKKCLTESMGDAWDAYWYHGDLLGKIIAPYMEIKMKNVVAHSNYAIYVTKKYLQKKYPCKCKNIYASNVYIQPTDEKVLEQRIKKIEAMDFNNISVMTSACVETVAKGHRYVIEMISVLKKEKINVTYFLAGSGNQERLKKVARQYGVEDNVIFLGEVTLKEIYYYLDKTDLYIQPSLQEGLPRAVIEAMSRGCPCIGSETAGTPELLPKNCIFKRKSARAIKDTLKAQLDTKKLVENAIRNFRESQQYCENTLKQRRDNFFTMITNEIKS